MIWKKDFFSVKKNITYQFNQQILFFITFTFKVPIREFLKLWKIKFYVCECMRTRNVIYSFTVENYIFRISNVVQIWQYPDSRTQQSYLSVFQSPNSTKLGHSRWLTNLDFNKIRLYLHVTHMTTWREYCVLPKLSTTCLKQSKLAQRVLNLKVHPEWTNL